MYSSQYSARCFREVSMLLRLGFRGSLQWAASITLQSASHRGTAGTPLRQVIKEEQLEQGLELIVVPSFLRQKSTLYYSVVQSSCRLRFPSSVSCERDITQT